MAKEDFKRFVRSHPELVNYVNKGTMSWQKFYEMYDIYGESNSIWKEYQVTNQSVNNTSNTASKNNTVGDTSLKDLFNMVKKIDLDSVRKGAEGLQKAIALVQDFSLGSKQTNNYQARPLYKHLED